MRILFATSIRTWGGGEEWMLAHAVALAERGHDVSLIAPARSVIRERARDAGLAGPAADFLSDAGFLSFLRVFRWCRKRRIEVLCLNMDRVLRVAGTAARLAGVPVVLPRRGSEFPLKPGLLYRLTYRRVATGVIVNSEATARSLVRRITWRPAGAVTVIPNGLPPERTAARRARGEVRAELGIPEDAPVVIGIGELTRRKNFALLLDALAGIRREVPGTRLVIAGRGDQEADLRERAERAGVEEAVVWTGFRRDVPDLLGAADVLAHPARVEGFGYVVAEAMAAGLPVVATNASSLPEIVADGTTGVLFPPEDREALAAAIVRYLRDPALRRAHGEAGRARAAREYSFARRLEELEQCFRDGLAGTG